MGDTVETAVAWATAIENCTRPTCLLFSRQNLRHIVRTTDQISNISRGGYIIAGGTVEPDAIIIATGSEVSMAIDAAESLSKEGHKVRVVSMPSTDVFDAQDEQYRNSVLPPHVRKRVAVEAGIPDFWSKYTGLDGKVLGVPGFGESAPGNVVYEHFGITTPNLIKLVSSLL